MRPWFAALAILSVVGLGAITNQYLRDTRELPIPMAAGVSLVTVVLPLVFLRYRLLWAWRLSAIGVLVGSVDQSPDEAWPWNPVQVLVMLVVLFLVAAREPRGVILSCGLVTTALIWVQVHSGNVVGATLLIVAVMGVGEQVQRRRRAQVELEEESERSQLLTERARMARELHDVVAHSLSLVAVRAETAPYRLDGGLSGPAREEFLALAATARESLTELRRLLGVLRTDSGGAELAPQPTLSDVDDLVGAMCDAGMEIHYGGTDYTPPAATGLTAYRVVQEALTNAARHAPGAPVRVEVAHDGGELCIAVHNGASRESVRPSKAGGHGLIGMRERVELLGGSLHYGPAGGGGFSVTAVMPVD